MRCYFVFNGHLNTTRILTCIFSVEAKWYLKANQIFFEIFLENPRIFKYEYTSIPIKIVFLRTPFVAGIRLISFYSFWYYKKMHILRPKKFPFALMSHLSFVEYILNSPYVWAYYKHSKSVVWKSVVCCVFPLSTDISYRCGSSHSNLFMKTSAHKK